MDLYSKCKNANFESVLKKLNYKYFSNGSYDMNIIGVRSSRTTCDDKFCDYLILEYKDKNGKLNKHIYPITTCPGRYYLLHPMSSLGCAILVPGQYKGAYTFGLHKSQYRALVQIKPLKIYRDNNKDSIFDYNKASIKQGIYGINIHKAGANSSLVHTWSAGCQVFAKSKDFYEFMSLVELQEKNGLGNKFTYTLIDEKDIQ